MRTAAAALLVLAGLGGCAAPGPGPGWRRAGPRGELTIFSALELPTPTTLRNAAGAPGPDYWQQQADYVIEASLDPATRLLRGRESIRYVNNSPDPLPYVWLHLEQNLFRADSLGEGVRRNNLGPVRRDGAPTAAPRRTNPGRNAIAAPGEMTEGAVIRSLKWGGGDVPYSVYDTLARVDLPAPLAPGGGELLLEIEWEFTVPAKVFRRFGSERVAQGEIFEIAQWFPAMAVYDDVHGWNTLPYLGQGEFYTDFGDYDVKLTVPREHLLVATGELQNPAEVYTGTQQERLAAARKSAETVVIVGADEVGTPGSRPAGEGPLTWHFKAERVRTFAFATSEAFLLDAAGLSLDVLEEDLATTHEVLVQSAYPKEAQPLWEQSTQMLRTAIEGYSRRWFPYPYPVATNVNGPEGGMEYPMIVFCGNRDDEERLYSVTTHEIGHNWFPMLVNTDERRHAWMDEGFNTFINYYSHGEWFPGKTPERGEPALFAPKMLRPDQLPVDTPPDRLPRRLIGDLQYSKAGTGLVLLREQILGPERFDFAFRTYVRRWAWKSPRPADFYRTMEDAAGADLAWFWRGWFRETGWLDQAVVDVSQAGDPFEHAVIGFANLGELVMPLVYRVRFADGTERTERLPVEIWAAANAFQARVETGQRIVEVVIDPGAGYPDVKRENNSWRD